MTRTGICRRRLRRASPPRVDPTMEPRFGRSEVQVLCGGENARELFHALDFNRFSLKLTFKMSCRMVNSQQLLPPFQYGFCAPSSRRLYRRLHDKSPREERHKASFGCESARFEKLAAACAISYAGAVLCSCRSLDLSCRCDCYDYVDVLEMDTRQRDIIGFQMTHRGGRLTFFDLG